MLLRLGCVSKFVRLTIELVTASVAGGATLWWVATSPTATTAKAIVHVTEADVRVQVGGFTFDVSEPSFKPIVCQLPPGEHRLVMSSGSTELHSETFTVGGGEEVVLTAWNSHQTRGGHRSTALGATIAHQRIPKP